MRIFSATAIALALASPAAAQSLSKDLICSELVPPMLEFVGSVEDLPENFDAVYQQLSPVDQETFRDVQTTGTDLSDAVKAYRAAFIVACFSE